MPFASIRNPFPARAARATRGVAFSSVLFTALLLAAPAEAQRAEWGEVDREELVQTSFAADSDAAAVILSDYGTVEVKSDMQLVFHRHRRIKLLTEAAYDAWGTASVTYRAEDRAQRLDDLEGHTFVLGPDGQIERHEMKKDAVFTEDIDGEYERVRFTLPALQPGAIIEYRYEIESDHPGYLPDWSFQTSEPTLWSEYRYEIPELLDYTTQFQGTQPLSVREAEPSRMRMRFDVGKTSAYRTRSFNMSMNAQKHRWAMQDVPALREEPFMTTPEDYRAKLRFQLTRIGVPGELPLWTMKSWADNANDLLEADYFGREIGRHKELRRQAEKLTEGIADEAEKLRAVYDFVRTTIQFNGEMGYGLDHDLDDVLEAKTGSSAEIALVLVSMLRDAGLEAHPVLISTRDHGRVQELYPFNSQFNDVIVYAEADGGGYLLDATDPLRPHMLLPSQALNHRGWLVRKDAPQWIDIQPGSAERRLAFVQAVLAPDGTVSGTLAATEEEYAALDAREALKDQTAEEYARGLLAEGLGGVEVTSAAAEHQGDVYEPLKTKADFAARAYAQAAGDFIYLNPVMAARQTENPLRRPERTFPVDLAYPREWTYTLSLELPEGYAVHETPQNIQVQLPDDAGGYMRLIDVQNGRLMLRSRFVMAQTLFASEHYALLREFYDRVVAAEAEQVVLKRAGQDEAAAPDEASVSDEASASAGAEGEGR